MSHVVVIIQRARDQSTAVESTAEPSYTYEIPVPHGATPQQVGELVRKAYKRLEGDD